MNAKNAHDFIPLLQALGDGKIIQEDYFGEWSDLSGEISFSMKPEFYRIKREPRTFEIVRSKLSGSIYNSETYDGSAPSTWEYITVQEVLQ